MTLSKMLKRIIYYSNLLLITLFFFSFNIFAQSTDSADSQGWFCAKITSRTARGASLAVQLEVDQQRHPLQPNNEETYLVECLSYSQGDQLLWECTTGDSAKDQEAFGGDNLSSLRSNAKYSLTGIYKIVGNQQSTQIGARTYQTGPTGGLIIKDSNESVSSFEWQSQPLRVDRKFYFFQKITSLNTTQEVGSGGQQQATSFDWISGDQDCAVVRWDPAGRVFDAYSLEPIPGAQVYLTKKNNQGNFVDARTTELGIVNPQATNPQGKFSFYVSDGDYKLSVLNFTSLGYVKVAESLSEINSKYNQVYFYEQNGTKNIYIYPSQTGEVIEQRGKLQYRDIPLIPNSSYPEGRSYDLQVLSGFQSVDRLTGNFKFEGSVSHPFTIVKIYGLNETGEETLVYQGIADNQGNYKISFPQQKDGKTFTQFRVDFEKANLRLISQSKSFLNNLLSFFSKHITIFAQDKQVKNKLSFFLNPIPTYIEGVAYDNKGQILPNTEISVYVQGTNVPYKVVRTDSNGFYRLGSNQLPALPYYLKYKDANGNLINVTTRKVIADNKSLIETKKVDLYTLKNEQGKTITKPAEENNQGLLSQTPSSEIKVNQNPSLTNQTSGNQAIILIAAVVFFLILITAIVFYFYLRQRNTSGNY
jgi:hypothetical protein